MVEENPDELAVFGASVNAALCNGVSKAAVDTLCAACDSDAQAVCGREESCNAADYIVLIGMPGAGKSTCIERLLPRAAAPFIPIRQWSICEASER